MFVLTKKSSLLAGVLFCAAGLATASAQTSNSFVVFSVDMSSNVANGTFIPATESVSVRGTFNNWAGSGGTFGDGSVQLTEQGLSAPYLYTNTIQDTWDLNGGSVEYKFIIESNTSPGYSQTYETLNSGDNRNAPLPTNSGGTAVLPTPYFSDSGAPQVWTVNFNVDVSQQIALGNFPPGPYTNNIGGPPYTNGGTYVEVRGIFNAWTGGMAVLTNNPSILRTNQYGLVTSNVWVGTYTTTNSPWGIDEFKYVLQPGTVWDSPSAGFDLDRDSGNRYFADTNQTLPLVNFSDEAFAPLATAVFSVNMSAVAQTDPNYQPSLGPSYQPTLWGSFNGWGSAFVMTNELPPNTNIWVAVTTNGAGSAQQYQYRYVNAVGTTIYDHYADGSNNRLFTQPTTNTVVPTVYFNDIALADYILQTTPVYFAVNMKNSSGQYVTGTDGHQFNPTTDAVYINGPFYAWDWAGASPPTSPVPGLMVESNSSSIYTNTIYLPAPQTVAVTYKYGLAYGVNTNAPNDDEAISGDNHERVVRQLFPDPANPGTNKLYIMAPDTFGNQYQEPIFDIDTPSSGNLAVGAVSGGTVPVTWLGRPGAHLQTSTSVTNQTWTDVWATDGTNWNTGFGSTNGFVSETNYPVSSGTTTFFRLVEHESEQLQ